MNYNKPYKDYDAEKEEMLSFELPTDTEGIEIPQNSPLHYEVETYYIGNNEDRVLKDKANVLVIFTGKGGSVLGYKNKYQNIARMQYRNYVRGMIGWHTFVIENPGISRDNPELYFDSAMSFIYEKMKGYEKLNIVMMGFSAGGHFVGRFAYKYPDITKVLLVNPVLRVDFEKLKNAMLKFNGDITIVQGDKDTDFQFNPLLKQFGDKVRIEVLAGVDHQFSNEGGYNTFINLPAKYLCDSKNYRLYDKGARRGECKKCGKTICLNFTMCEFCGRCITDEGLERCPFCFEEVKIDEKVCSKCGQEKHPYHFREEGFPREDIEDSMKKYKDETELSDKNCPHCNQQLKRIHFRSPKRTWEHLCGRDGELLVCENCKKDYNFHCHVMN